MIEAAFECATRLFGVTFSERRDIPVWHPDVRVWEVKDGAGRHKALFYGDYFAPALEAFRRLDDLAARPAEARRRHRSPDHQCLQFLQGRGSEPSLLSPDDARTLFHEFGHGLHGVLSDVTYPSL